MSNIATILIDGGTRAVKNSKAINVIAVILCTPAIVFAVVCGIPWSIVRVIRRGNYD